MLENKLYNAASYSSIHQEGVNCFVMVGLIWLFDLVTWRFNTFGRLLLIHCLWLWFEGFNSININFVFALFLCIVWMVIICFPSLNQLIKQSAVSSNSLDKMIVIYVMWNVFHIPLNVVSDLIVFSPLLLPFALCCGEILPNVVKLEGI